MSVDLAYIFPNILPEDGVVFPLSHLFAQFVFLRPVEDDLPDANTLLLRVLESQPEGQGSVINYSCPAPLSQDRDGFLALLRDIRLRPDDYAGHLSNLSAGPAPVIEEDEREHSIINTLLQQTGIRARSEEHTSEPEKGQEKKEKNVSRICLWQARMLLKLGESVDIQQAEIRHDLTKMTRQQDEVLRTLRRAREEEEKIAFDLSTIVPDEEISLEQQRLRLRAWSRLFALSEIDFANTAFISQSSEAVEALMEQYQQKYSCTVKPLLTLPLPLACIACTEAFTEQDFARRDDFQDKASSLLITIRGLLDGSTDPHYAGETEQKWVDLLDRHYPAADYGRCTLTLYFLPEILPQEFFLETFAPKDQSSEKKENKRSQRAGAGMVLGVLKG